MRIDAGGLLSFGLADVGGETCKTRSETLKSSGKEIVQQAADDFAVATTVSFGTWLNGTKMNMQYKRLG